MPKRNFEVGTPEEQEERFNSFCSRYGWHEIDGLHCSKKCPLYKQGDSIVLCVLTWGQLPYDGKGGKDKSAKKNSSKTTNKNSKETK